MVNSLQFLVNVFFLVFGKLENRIEYLLPNKSMHVTITKKFRICETDQLNFAFFLKSEAKIGNDSRGVGSKRTRRIQFGATLRAHSVSEK